MIKRPLGRSGIEVSAIGLGCWAIGGETWMDGKASGWAGANDEESIRGIHAAMDLGVNLIDTADAYGAGHSERLIAKALDGRRDRAVIVTKFGFQYNEEKKTTEPPRYDEQYIRYACDASLRRLKTDYIDVYLFHINRATPEEGAVVRDVLDNLVSEGKIRWHGWSTDFPQNARVFAESARCTAFEMNFNIFSGNEQTLDICEKENIAALMRNPLFKGLLTGKFGPDTKFPEGDTRFVWDLAQGEQAGFLTKLNAIREILTSNGRTPAQGALCWLMTKSPAAFPLPGFKTVAQVIENTKTLEFPLFSREQMQEIGRLLKE